jgi:hypothetical protein
VCLYLPPPHVCHVFCASNTLQTENPNSIWWRVQIMKPCIVQFSPACFRTSIAYGLPLMWATSFLTHMKTTCRITEPCVRTFIIIVMCCNSRREDERLQTEWWQVFPKFYLFSVSSYIKFWFISALTKSLNLAIFQRIYVLATLSACLEVPSEWRGVTLIDGGALGEYYKSICCHALFCPKRLNQITQFSF